MTIEEVRESLGFFPDKDQWLGFIELAGQTNNLRSELFAPATREIRAHFRNNLPEGWRCGAHGETREDTRWYHEKYGPFSLSLWFGWKYEFILRLHDEVNFNSAGMTAALLTAEYAPVMQAMERVDPHPQTSCKVFERRNFHFDCPNDGVFNPDELAWFAYYHKDEFVRQAVKKVERFLKNPEVVRLLEKLNHDFKAAG